MRYEMEGRNLFVMPDAPVLRHYRVDYLNVAREARSEIGASTSIARGGSGGGAGNSSNSTLTNNSHNRFWETLTQNIRDLLRETDKIIPEGERLQHRQRHLRLRLRLRPQLRRPRGLRRR